MRVVLETSTGYRIDQGDLRIPLAFVHIITDAAHPMQVAYVVAALLVPTIGDKAMNFPAVGMSRSGGEPHPVLRFDCPTDEMASRLADFIDTQTKVPDYVNMMLSMLVVQR